VSNHTDAVASASAATTPNQVFSKSKPEAVVNEPKSVAAAPSAVAVVSA